MTTAYGSSHFPRLLEVLLPNGGAVAVMALVEGYFDESGDFDDAPGVFCISGYYISSDAAKEMDKKWAEVLETHNIPYFHMVDCAHGNETCEGKEVKERIEIVKKFIDLIKKYTITGFSAVCREQDFQVSEKHPDVYSACVALAVRGMRAFLEINRMNHDISYFFETGHKNRGRAFNHIADHLRSVSSPITFAAKEDIRLLQAADLLAWQTAKYQKDKITGARPPRKDFLSMMEHMHSFVHMNVANGEDSLAFEDWPLSRRSQTTVGMSIGKDGPITYLTEDGDDMPIIPIEAATGHRMGGGRMALVRFKDLKAKQFALAFDQHRLYEAALSLVSAMDIYDDEQNRLVLPATDVLIERVEGGALLEIRAPNKIKLTFFLSEDMLKRLKE